MENVNIELEEIKNKTNTNTKPNKTKFADDYEAYPLKQYHQNLLKLVDLLEEECIDETQLKDIIVNLKNKANQITWTQEHETVLKRMAEKCSCYVYLHNKSFKYYSKVHLQFTMPMFIITLISSFLMFVSSSYYDYHYFGLIAGSINLLVATIQKIMEFVQPERFKIEHQATSKIFEALSSNIRIQLSLPIDERDPMPMYLTKTINDFSVVRQNSPAIKDMIVKEFNYRFKSNYEIYKPQESGIIYPVQIHTPTREEITKGATFYKSTNKIYKSNLNSSFKSRVNTLTDSEDEINLNPHLSAADKFRKEFLSKNLSKVKTDNDNLDNDNLENEKINIENKKEDNLLKNI